MSITALGAQFIEDVQEDGDVDRSRLRGARANRKGGRGWRPSGATSKVMMLPMRAISTGAHRAVDRPQSDRSLPPIRRPSRGYPGSGRTTPGYCAPIRGSGRRSRPAIYRQKARRKGLHKPAAPVDRNRYRRSSGRRGTADAPWNHCTGYRGKCPEPYTREEIFEQQVAGVLRDLVIPPAVLAWLQSELG